MSRDTRKPSETSAACECWTTIVAAGTSRGVGGIQLRRARLLARLEMGRTAYVNRSEYYSRCTRVERRLTMPLGWESRSAREGVSKRSIATLQASADWRDTPISVLSSPHPRGAIFNAGRATCKLEWPDRLVVLASVAWCTMCVVRSSPPRTSRLLFLWLGSTQRVRCRWGRYGCGGGERATRRTLLLTAYDRGSR
jgi:hypothetical protein